MPDEQENKNEVSLAELEQRARDFSVRKSKAPEKTEEPKVEETTEIVPIEELPVLDKNPGGRPAKSMDKNDLSDKDVQIMTLLACGIEKTVIASIAGVDRRTLYRLLDSERVQRFTEGARKRVASLAPLAAEILHAELLKGNVEVAKSILKGLSIMKTSVNQKQGEKEKTTAEEIIDSTGRTTRRIIKETESLND